MKTEAGGTQTSRLVRSSKSKNLCSSSTSCLVEKSNNNRVHVESHHLGKFFFSVSRNSYLYFLGNRQKKIHFDTSK